MRIVKIIVFIVYNWHTELTNRRPIETETMCLIILCLIYIY